MKVIPRTALWVGVVRLAGFARTGTLFVRGCAAAKPPVFSLRGAGGAGRGGKGLLCFGGAECVAGVAGVACFVGVL